MDIQRLLFAVFLGLSATAVLGFGFLLLGARDARDQPVRGRGLVGAAALLVLGGWLGVSAALADHRHAFGATEMSLIVLLSVGIGALPAVRAVVGEVSVGWRAALAGLRLVGLARLAALSAGWLPGRYVAIAVAVDVVSVALAVWAGRSGSVKAARVYAAVAVVGGVTVSALAAVTVRPCPTWELLHAMFTAPFWAVMALATLPRSMPKPAEAG